MVDSLRKKVIVLIASVAVALIVLSSYALTTCFFQAPYSPPFGTSEKSIVRNTDNAEEENALSAAETANYSAIYNLPKFIPEPESAPDYPSEIWADYIDSETLSYLESRFDSVKGKIMDVYLNYKAEVFDCNQARIVYTPPPENGTKYDDHISVLSQNGTALYVGPGYSMSYAQKINGGYATIPASEINVNLDKFFLVEMRLNYAETHGTLAAWSSLVHQIVIVDESFAPVLFGLEASQGIA